MIISISGLIGSGKDTVADYLCQVYGFKRMSFAASLKDSVASIFNWDRDWLEGRTKFSREWRENKDEWWSKRLGMHITPRFILQNWGTELFRNSFHEDIWVASLENKLSKTDNDIVITDSRFKNELSAVKSVGGTTIRIFRGNNPNWHQDAVKFNTTGDLESFEKLKVREIPASEYSSVGLDYDFTILNNGTLNDLYASVKKILHSLPSAM